MLMKPVSDRETSEDSHAEEFRFGPGEKRGMRCRWPPPENETDSKSRHRHHLCEARCRFLARTAEKHQVIPRGSETAPLVV